MAELKSEQLKPAFAIDRFVPLSELEPIPFAALQPRAISAIKRLASFDGDCPVMLINGFPGADYEQVCRILIADTHGKDGDLFDLCYTENLNNPYKPIWLRLQPGSGVEFCEMVGELLKLMGHHLDAERLVTRIMRKQKNDPKIADFLSDLAAHVALGLEFQHPVLINLLIHHDEQQAPVVYGRDLNWDTLFGSINYQTEQGSVYANQHLLEPGLMREANGGYLILQLDELLDQPHLWFKLKNAIFKGELDWNAYQEGKTLTPFFTPEATPIRLKLILVGDRLEVAEFQMLDRDMSERIFLRADLVSEVEIDDELPDFLGYLAWIRQRWSLLDFTPAAQAALCRHASRLCDHQEWLSLSEVQLTALMRLADSLAREFEAQIIDHDHIVHALAEQDYRLNYLVEQSDQGVIDGQILLQTEGEEIGQINGLSVIQVAGHPYDFGEPVRLTATVHLGDGDVADIERKAELAGHIHAKAMMIIHGYLSNKFGAENPSPLSANLVFEQSYHEIDGDSASLTGLCALLSALARQPIYQHFAVTGAVDQFGNVQAVGGVNEKIEGFFRVCQIHGLNGKQGILLPGTNAQQLNLSDEVIAAVEQGMFHIHPVDHVEEAIEMLTGCVAGEPDMADTLFGRIQQRLDDLNGTLPKTGIMRTILGRLFGH
ncbi:Lon protease family protein [Aeromonas rivuli]|uniref:Lon protease family protein n=1 Tax=Aeromonas rivuli TaxID=648794 RepID=UPI001CCBEDB3|nr:AAA family ATPase [Aeromonas rivuli]UBO75825.1 AAA family ATPase [Aeromonas rivuli]